MSMALTLFASVFLLRRADPERFLVVQRAAPLAVLPAGVVHAFALGDFTNAVINLLSALPGVTQAVTTAVRDDGLNRVIAALLQVVIIRVPL